MRESTAAEVGLTVDEQQQRVAAMRAAQGLPPKIQEPTVLQHVADLMRASTPEKRRRRRRQQ